MTGQVRWLRQIPVLLLLLLMAAPLLRGQQTAGRDGIRELITRYGQAEVVISYPGREAMTTLASRFPVSSCDGLTAVLCLSHNDTAAFLAAGIPFKPVIPDERKGFHTASSVAEAMQWHTYPTWQHYDTIMHLLAERWPQMCRLDTIGFSVRGRAVLVLELTDRNITGACKPGVMLSSSIHGDELAGFVLLMRLAEYLASHGGESGTPAAQLMSRLRIWINPLSNPDGTYRNGDTIQYPVRANSNGYDLNRNFPDPEDPAPQPLQKETADMIRFLEERRPVLSANLHGGAEVVNYPWDKWDRRHPDDEWFRSISRHYADTVHRYSGIHYMRFLDDGITRGSVWYKIRGGRQDYVTYSLGGREVTLEINDEKLTPGPALGQLWEWNQRSLLNYLSEALNGVRGMVTDAGSGDPVRAKIVIEGHDADSSHVWSDAASGFYLRMLPPGTWRLTFTAPGYEPLTTETVLTGDEPRLTRDISLRRSEVSHPDPPLSGLVAWPNPSDGYFNLMLPETVSGRVTLRVIDASGALVRQHHTIAQPRQPVPCDLTGMPPGVYVVVARREPFGPAVRGKVVITRLPAP